MDTEKKNLLVFGYGLAVIFAFISFKIWRDYGWIAIHAVFMVCMVALIIVTKLKYEWLKPLYRRWMQAAHFIGNIITGFILTLLFYFVFGLAGIVLRILRKDLLNRKIDDAVNSYWINKDQIDFNKSHYTRQF